MIFSEKLQSEIYLLIEQVISEYLNKAKDAPIANSGNPFILALLKDFEPLIHRIHGLKGSMGNKMEKVAELIAIDAWGRENVRRKVKENVELPIKVFQLIDSIINNLSNAKTLSDYYKEKQEIIRACDKNFKKTQQHLYEFDLLLTDNEKRHLYILEMKGPDPNTTEVSGAKKRLLVSIAWNYIKNHPSDIDAKLAIYYNNKFPRVYKNPKVHYYFNPDGGIIVQDTFWNFLGKDENTFSDLVKLFEDYGKENKKRIWDGFSKLII